MSLVPLGKPTFPDQQQDLQNAADFSLASECDGSVKFARLGVKVDSEGLWSPGGVWVGWAVSDVENSLCDQLPNQITQLPRRGITVTSALIVPLDVRSELQPNDLFVARIGDAVQMCSRGSWRHIVAPLRLDKIA
jgi:hypothetical protein